MTRQQGSQQQQVVAPCAHTCPLSYLCVLPDSAKGLQGSVTEFRVWDRALKASEVMARSRWSLDRGAAPGLRACWASARTYPTRGGTRRWRSTGSGRVKFVVRVVQRPAFECESTLQQNHKSAHTPTRVL